MIGFCPLASGSKGNCIFIGTEKTRLLIDCGISAKNIKERLSHIGIDIETIDAICVSHEHTDHIQGIKALALKYSIPILANAETAKAIAKTLDECPKFKIFTTGDSFEYKDVVIHPFGIQHDAVDPVAFTVKTAQHKIGICTDLGFATKPVQSQLKGCDILYIESNHQEDLVHLSKRPPVYKNRVLGRWGHLSNTACGELLCEIACDRLQHVYLAHLSKECNRPELALEEVGAILDRQGISLPLSVAHQDMVSRVTLFH